LIKKGKKMKGEIGKYKKRDGSQKFCNAVFNFSREISEIVFCGIKPSEVKAYHNIPGKIFYDRKCRTQRTTSNLPQSTQFAGSGKAIDSINAITLSGY